MSRLHLFEFEDLKWFPSFLRNYGTDFLQFLANKTPMFDPAVPIIQKALDNNDAKLIIDLGSGGGGGLLRINKALLKENPGVKILLTDYYPNIAAFEYTKKQAENISFFETSIDARNVPDHLRGLRTMFLSLHHFKPEDARLILQNAVDSKSPIAIFEGQERSAASLIAMFFSPLTVLLTTPLIRPFKFWRIVFTYLIPIVPLFVWWDGMVSSLRTYSVVEMEQLVDGLKNKNHFDWEIKRIKSGPGIVLYLVGVPKYMAAE